MAQENAPTTSNTELVAMTVWHFAADLAHDTVGQREQIIAAPAVIVGGTPYSYHREDRRGARHCRL